MNFESLHPALKAAGAILIIIAAMYLVPPVVVWISGKTGGGGAVFLISVLLIIWGLPVILGWAKGRKKGHTNLGILLPLFFSWIGYFIVEMLSDRKQAVALSERQNTLLEQTLLAQQEQIEQLKQMAQSAAQPQAAQIPAGHFLIASGGKELGYFLPVAIKAMLASDQITLSDHYLDERSNRWMQIIDHPLI